MAYKTSISIENARDKEVIFHLEPWGDQIPMPAGCKFQIFAEAKEQGELEIQYEEDNILVWGWSGSIVSVYCDGQVVSAGHTAVPSVPEGQSVSSFIHWITGKNKS
jgi:hypothetical protein